MNILKFENICSPLICSMTGAIFDDECLELLIEIGVAQVVEDKTAKDQCEECSLMAAHPRSSSHL